MNFNTLACHLEVKIRVDWHDAKLQSSEQLLSSVVYIINRFFRAGVSFSCIGKQNWGIETESKRHTLLAEVSIMMYIYFVLLSLLCTAISYAIIVNTCLFLILKLNNFFQNGSCLRSPYGIIAKLFEKTVREELTLVNVCLSE